jgi:predicted solute-binding protein
MNAFKISLVEWRDLLSKSFVFEVDWVRKAEDEAKALEAKLEEFKSDMQDEMQYSYVLKDN